MPIAYFRPTACLNVIKACKEAACVLTIDSFITDEEIAPQKVRGDKPARRDSIPPAGA